MQMRIRVFANCSIISWYTAEIRYHNDSIISVCAQIRFQKMGHLYHDSKMQSVSVKQYIPSQAYLPKCSGFTKNIQRI